ncbi:DJ-1/PfpI family protein [Actinoplanes derwentensis]|uniref:DJ-1/PfpI family protein n=1 Tax=Actinoplanes derwentensis TaxID=113562 RepID=A0A1H1ZCD9_9ACTN|nr:DJ-1/PfpI family protein [Actinoplanes derwentensis]GID82366.1 glutamine amidotransferase [Actinoplanes derwentensis]SDT31384.1 DJ-1/PfpI family protein [Actinoplanes derwentensis]
MYAQIVLFDGFDPLDVVAPLEVLVAGSALAGNACDVRLVSAQGPRRVVSGTAGLALDATAALDPDLPGYVLIPGASGPLDDIPGLLAQAARTELAPLAAKALANPEITVATVCGGSLLLGLAGLLTGRTAVTHAGGLDALRSTGVTVVDARVVDDGDLISGAGVTSGLDLALHLVERSFGPRVAHEVEQLIQYERRGIVWR